MATIDQFTAGLFVLFLVLGVKILADGIAGL
jgi:hypothetical protein